jgi:uncharacterized protein (DUF169 family)
VNYFRISELLTESLSLQQPPVAISFADSVPAGVGRFSGQVPAGCRFWQEAATSVFATSAAQHDLCAIGVYTHNLQPSEKQQTDLADALNVFKQLGYVRDEDLPHIPVLQSRSEYVIYSPLAQSPLPPDLVLLLVDAAQTLILSEAASQLENQNAPAMGRPACAVVPQVINSGRAALSLGCCGARAYLDTLNEGTALFAIPGPKLELYAAQIQALAKANSVLAKFHQIRRRDVEAGQMPTIKESLSAMGA